MPSRQQRSSDLSSGNSVRQPSKIRTRRRRHEFLNPRVQRSSSEQTFQEFWDTHAGKGIGDAAGGGVAAHGRQKKPMDNLLKDLLPRHLPKGTSASHALRNCLRSMWYYHRRFENIMAQEGHAEDLLRIILVLVEPRKVEAPSSSNGPAAAQYPPDPPLKRRPAPSSSLTISGAVSVGSVSFFVFGLLRVRGIGD